MSDNCVPIVLEQIRARIEIGSYYYVTTGTDDNAAGDIMSFSISSNLDQPSAQFKCMLSVKFDSGILNSFQYVDDNLGQKIIVYAGIGTSSDQNLPRLFTGYITGVSQDPHWEDARKFILNISGEDTFALMKYGPKYSRRFKSQDDAFAVVTGGKHREGGRMTQLRRVSPGSRGVDHIDTGSNDSLEHSPLIRTPDPQGLSPNGSLAERSSEANKDNQGRYRANPAHVYAREGDRVFIKIIDEKTGDIVDTASIANTTGVSCMCQLQPRYDSSGNTSTGGGIKPGENTFPVKLNGFDSNGESGIDITVTRGIPANLTFVHPLTAGSCSVVFHQIPPHTHRTMQDGGPAVATYDVSSV